MSAVTRSATASPSVSLLAAVDPSWFPLKCISDVVQFFRRTLESSDPDLTLLSIVAGYVELSLTTGEVAQAAAAAAAAAASSNEPISVTSPSSLIAVNAYQTVINSDVIRGNAVPFPLVTHEVIAGLYKKFQSILAVIEKPKSHNRPATRELIKKVSDVIWHSLIRSTYKDRAHLQNLYSYLSGNKLDSFGVALAVVAGCQLLGYRDVHLAVSEDHAWVVFGSSKRPETIEVTWHGKGSEDKRGQDISPGIESRSWLYLLGQAVVCDRYMEVAAIVSAINISLSASSDCVEVADMQQQLLWLLHDMGHLKRYPMALGSLGELEEINPTRRDVNCDQLYEESITASRNYYNNHHVYPYTYLGNYYNRIFKYREAFAAWANAADVIRLYTYQCRDDEEIYKELLDIANEMIPHVMKTESSGHSGRSILRDSEVFANLLRFYDGICQWEEDSLTPILHIGWAKPLVNNITKFDYDIRSQVVIKVPEEGSYLHHHNNNNNNNNNNNAHINKDKKHINNVENNNNNNTVKMEEKLSNEVNKKPEMPAILANLTAACGEKILNPDFLLQGGGQPFAEQKQQTEAQNETNQSEKKSTDEKEKHNEMNKAVAVDKKNNKSNGTEKEQSEKETSIKKEEVEAVKEETKTDNDEDDPRAFILKRPVITLYSQKMKGLRDLLLAEKLNTHAISLQVTAQSVPSRKVRGVDKFGHHAANTDVSSATTATAATAVSTAADSIAASRPKRTRRE